MKRKATTTITKDSNVKRKRGLKFSDFHDKDKVACWSSENDMKPHQVSIGTDKKFKFDCRECKHQFSSALNHITRKNGTWCPFCAGQKLCDESRTCDHCLPRSFTAFHDKAKVACWSSENDMKPHQVAMACNKKFKFDCRECKHQFSSELNHITRKNGTWCPFCAGKKLCDESRTCDHCLRRSFGAFHDKAKVACWSSENDMKPHQVAMACNKKFRFDCRECKHQFSSALNSITRKNGRWCPFCGGKRLCDESATCDHCLHRSFAAFHDKDKVTCWSADNDLKPHQVAMACNKKFKFDCRECKHQFASSLNNITGNNARWCPFCAGRSLCKESRTCDHCLPRSFAAFHDKAKVACWSSENELEPHQVSISNGKKFKFDCRECKHQFSSGLNNITRKNGTWCPFCNSGRVCGQSSCGRCPPACSSSMCHNDGQFYKARYNTKEQGWLCYECCFKLDLLPPNNRAKIRIEILAVREMQRIASRDPELQLWTNYTSQNCMVLDGLSFRPDMMWAFDSRHRLVRLESGQRLDLDSISYVLILEIVEISRAAHSKARTPCDEERERLIREEFTRRRILCGFLYVTIANDTDSGAHPSDAFFRKNKAEQLYHVIPARKKAWQHRMRRVVSKLQDMRETMDTMTRYIGR